MSCRQSPARPSPLRLVSIRRQAEPSVIGLVPAQCVLVALIHIAKDATVCQLVGELHCIETLLRLLQDYELPFKGLVATLLQVFRSVLPHCPVARFSVSAQYE